MSTCIITLQGDKPLEVSRSTVERTASLLSYQTMSERKGVPGTSATAQSLRLNLPAAKIRRLKAARWYHVASAEMALQPPATARQSSFQRRTTFTTSSSALHWPSNHINRWMNYNG